MSMHRGGVAIVGAAETDEVGVLPTHSTMALHAEASLRAIADAGLSPRDIDGVATTRPAPHEVAQHLGITPRYVDGTAVGGTSFMLHVRHAAAAIAEGAATAVLISHGQSGRSGVAPLPIPALDPSSGSGQFEAPYGAHMPFTAFTLPVMHFLAERGMSRDDLARVVVAQRKYAVDNPRAFRRKTTTVEEVLAGSAIAYPFTKEMCCVVTDGGGALVMTSAERAADLPSASRAVYLQGSGEATETTMVSQMKDLGSFDAFRRSAADAFASAGIGPSDIDHLMGYDAFAHLPLYMLEDLGFVGKGESGQFIADGQTGRNGSLPMNTNGGGLSYTHTGMYGMFAIQESVRQLRGEAAVQLEGVTTSFVQGVGGYFYTAGSLILSNQRG